MREVRQYGCHVFVTWSWHGISLGGMRHDLVEVRVATHLGSVSDDVRGDANVSQSPADSRCTLPFFQPAGKLAEKAPMQLKMQQRGYRQRKSQSTHVSSRSLSQNG